ncbi:MAG: hypothetical protein KGI71_04505 [Patescibacteria group bacterium]|nr:hypothetical protein [Patescibacteria group bacterium]
MAPVPRLKRGWHDVRVEGRDTVVLRIRLNKGEDPEAVADVVHDFIDTLNRAEGVTWADVTRALGEPGIGPFVERMGRQKVPSGVG